MAAVTITTPGGKAHASSVGWRAKATSPPSGVNVSTAVVVGGVPYEGAYEIIPAVEAQELPTARRTLERDLTVEGIPRFDVSNDYGTTVSIG